MITFATNQRHIFMDQLILTLNTLSTAMFLLGAIFLFLRANGNRARLLLSATFLWWFLDNTNRLIHVYMDGQPIIVHEFFSPFFLIFGNLLAIMTYPFAVETIRPGWINWKRGALLFVPWLCTASIYFGTLAVTQEPIAELNDFADFARQIGSFNVWFRIPLFIMTFAYLCTLLYFMTRYKHYYDDWCRENYADTSRMDINWLKYFVWGNWGISIFFGFMVFNMGDWAYLLHQLVIQLCFGLTLYKTLFHENPYPDNFFRETMNEEMAIQLNETDESLLLKGTYTDHLEEYKMIFEEWMRERAPYTHMDFKLLDVAVVLPLNRTYLSRFFNDGYNASFSQVVQDYRIRKAQEIFEQDRNITVKEVAKNCGFISLSSFHSAFLKKTGLTPRQYKNSIAVKQAMGS